MFSGINMFWALLRLILARAALEGIEKIKNDNRTEQQNSLNNHASIYKLNGFYFSLNENAQ